VKAICTAVALTLYAGASLAQVQGTNADFRMSLTTSAPKDAIYALWADPGSWARWDPQIERVTFSGPVRVGAKGRLKGTGGPENAFEITAAEPGVRFSYMVSAPGARISFDRRFEPGEPTRFTHAVRFSGAAGGFLSGILGKRFREGLPTAMERLKTQAEAGR
jgi:uncharacterized protein YndB with AHSA1/START domain